MGLRLKPCILIIARRVLIHGMLRRYGDGGFTARPKGYNFSLLDRSGGAGWDLACKLTRRRNALNRGRLSAGQALRHRYFSPLST